MKLLVDEMFAPALAEQLRRRGHDAEAVTEHSGLISLPDPEQFARAQAAERAVVTENVPDFMALDAHYRLVGTGHFGLILTSNAAFPRGQQATLGALVIALDALLRRPDLAEGPVSHVEWLQPA